MSLNKFFLLFLLLLSPQFVMAQQDPLLLVQETANTVLKEVVDNKAALNKDPSGIYSLISTHVLPHFDFDAMTRSAMGKYWRRATDAQKDSLVSLFRELLVRTYGVALLNYSGEDIEYLPVRPTDEKDRVTIRTRVKEGNGGPQIPVDYVLLFSNDAWKVNDVVIDGVSLVFNYRTSFAGEIRRSGIEGLIDTLTRQKQG